MNVLCQQLVVSDNLCCPPHINVERGGLVLWTYTAHFETGNRLDISNATITGGDKQLEIGNVFFP